MYLLSCCRASSILSLSRRQRNDHRDAPFVLEVRLAVEGDEIALFQQYTNENVAGCRNCKQQMSGRHHRSRPERQRKTKIERMANELIEQRSLEARMLCDLPLRMCVNLSKPKETKMVNEECTDQHGSPSNPEDCMENCSTYRVAQRPDHAGHRAPLPEQQDEYERG